VRRVAAWRGSTVARCSGRARVLESSHGRVAVRLAGARGGHRLIPPRTAQGVGRRRSRGARLDSDRGWRQRRHSVQAGGAKTLIQVHEGRPILHWSDLLGGQLQSPWPDQWDVLREWGCQPANPCQSCQPNVSTTRFTNKADGTACTDICTEGTCIGTPTDLQTDAANCGTCGHV
jgi:hypothetical protein